MNNRANVKTIDVDDSTPLRNIGTGNLVKIAPCGDEYEGKTYVGILLGDRH